MKTDVLSYATSAPHLISHYYSSCCVHQALIGSIDRQTDGWMDGWMDGRMDGWMEGWMGEFSVIVT